MDAHTLVDRFGDLLTRESRFAATNNRHLLTTSVNQTTAATTHNFYSLFIVEQNIFTNAPYPFESAAIVLAQYKNTKVNVIFFSHS